GIFEEVDFRDQLNQLFPEAVGGVFAENESKIYQSANPHFSGWAEIIDGQDGNMYLYVGEKGFWDLLPGCLGLVLGLVFGV
ncbi:7535_t:CDS:2, partial [Diversispora eburnea]